MTRASRAYFGGVPCYRLSRLAVLKDLRCHNFGGESFVLALHKWVAADSQSRGEHSAKVIRYSQIHGLFVLLSGRFGYTIEVRESAHTPPYPS
jgi:hypothetical protein